MEQSVNDSLLVRFLKKETSEEENAGILQWVSGSEKNREEFRRVHQAFHLSGLRQYESGIDIEAAWNRLYSQMSDVKRQDQSVEIIVSGEQKQRSIRKPDVGKETESVRLRQTEKQQSKIIREQRKTDPSRRQNSEKLLAVNVFWKVAASVAIVLAIGFGSLWTRQWISIHGKIANIRFESPAGEKSKVILADGTQVWLNSQTVLDYNASEPRKVNLVGEAYFDVVKDRKHPFEVTTASGLKVTVLGTKFNLRSFADENQVETTLEEGEVAITGISAGKAVRLKPGQQASFYINSKQLQIKNVSAAVYSVWKNNELRFRDISFRELVPRIERWYGVKVDLDQQISTTDRFTMTIKTESLRELLSMMQLTSKFNYEINGEKVTIREK